MSLPLDMWSSKNISGDIFHGCFVVTCTLFAFIGLIWLREQILHGGGPDWLERDEPNNQQHLNVLLPPIPEENPIDEVKYYFFTLLKQLICKQPILFID